VTLGIHPRKLLSSLVLATFWVFALAAVLAVVPAQAQQSTQQTSSSLEPSKLEGEKVDERLDRVEAILQELKAAQEEAKSEREKFLERLDRETLPVETLKAADENQGRKWDTRFDLIRRDPRNRLEGTGADAGWIFIPGRKTDIRLGGFIQLNVIHDFQNAGLNFGKFKVDRIPTSTDNTSNTEFDPRTTRMIFETRTDTSLGKYSTFLSADWWGSSNNSDPPEFRLRQAYVTGIGFLTGQAFLAGQATTTFMDLAVWPEMFDLGGPSSYIFVRQGLIRWSSEIDEAKHWSASFGIEEPDTNVTNGNGQKDWPDAVARVDGNHDWGHLMGAVLVRQLKATSTSGTGTDRAFAWGLNLSGKLAVPGSADNLKFQVQGGEGIGRYVEAELDNGGQDAVYNNATEKLEPLKEIGFFAAYQHWWTDKLRSTVGGSYTRVDNRSAEPSNAFKRAIDTLANLIYSPIKPLDVGIEYHWGQHEIKNGRTGHANRLMFSVKWRL